MEDQSHVRANELQALAIAKFDKSPLLNAEKLLIEKVVTGGWAYCGPKPKDTGPDDGPLTNDDDANNNPQEADKWADKENRQIRAEFVAWLCSDPDARERVHPRGIQVYGAVVTGYLDLLLLNIPFQLAFQHCRLNTICLQQAEVLQLDLEGSWVDEIRADSLIVKANVALRDGFTANGEVKLPFAQIGGVLDCSGGTFINPAKEGSGSALDLSGVNVKGYVSLSKGFTAKGEVRLVVAQIGSVVDCSGGKFINPLLPYPENPEKMIESSGRALSANGIDIKDYLVLNGDFIAEGEVNLSNAQVGGAFDCSGGTFTNQPKKNVSGSGTALRADGIVVKGDAFLGTDFKANGKVSFLGAQIGNTFDCSGGKFINPSDRALSAEGIHVKSHAFLRDDFTAEGSVNFYGAEIGGAFYCRKGNFEKAALDLRDCSAASLWDSGLNVRALQVADHTKWPQSGELRLEGFIYGRISSEGDIDVGKRLDWLKPQPGKPFRREPYLHLAKILQDSGDSEGALRVRVRMEELSRRVTDAGGEQSSKGLKRGISLIRTGMARLWNWILKVSIGYGYRPGRAIWGIFLLFALGWIVYGRSYRTGTMVPTDDTTYKEFVASNTEPRVPPHYPSFSPLFYSLENSLPVVKFGQGEKWHPGVSKPSTSFATSPSFVTWFLRIQILLGWLFATLFVAGVSGIVHKE